MTQKEWFDFCNEDSNRRTCLRIEEREKERKETAEKILIKGKQLVKKWLSRDDEKVGFMFDFEEFIKEQFGIEIKE